MNHTEPHETELHRLIRLFHKDQADLGAFTECQPKEIPAPFDRLLVHEHHMTVTVESFYNSLVDVEVLQFQTDGEYYSREILLKRQSDRVVVQYGIVGISANKLPDETRKLIESRQIPLGRVLIEHDLMRKVELMALWKIRPSPYLAGRLGAPHVDVVFGRSAMIYVNEEPVIQLLEIVR